MRTTAAILGLLLTAATALAIDEEYVELENGIRIPIRKAIPVSSGTWKAQGIQSSASSPRVESNLNKGTRATHQGFHVDYRIARENSPEIGYDLDAGFRLVDSLTGESLDPAVSRNLQFVHGGHLRWTGPNRLELKLSTGQESLARNNQPLLEHSIYQRGQISFDPLRHTTIRTTLQSTDRHRIDGSLLNEDALSTAVEQRFPPLPLRLTLTQASAWHSLQDSSAGDLERHRLMGAAHWNFQHGNTLSVGLESRMVSRESTDSSDLTSITFTELRLQPLPQIAVRLRATAEDRAMPGAEDDSDARLLIPGLSAGMDFRLTPGFETGIGILYRPNAPSTPANPSPAPAQITIFGSALF